MNWNLQVRLFSYPGMQLLGEQRLDGAEELYDVDVNDIGDKVCIQMNSQLALTMLTSEL